MTHAQEARERQALACPFPGGKAAGQLRSDLVGRLHLQLTQGSACQLQVWVPGHETLRKRSSQTWHGDRPLPGCRQVNGLQPPLGSHRGSRRPPSYSLPPHTLVSFVLHPGCNAVLHFSESRDISESHISGLSSWCNMVTKAHCAYTVVVFS